MDVNKCKQYKKAMEKAQIKDKELLRISKEENKKRRKIGWINYLEGRCPD